MLCVPGPCKHASLRALTHTHTHTCHPFLRSLVCSTLGGILGGVTSALLGLAHTHTHTCASHPLLPACSALGGNLGGVTSALLGLDEGQMARKLQLDALFPINAQPTPYKRCIDGTYGYGGWVFDGFGALTGRMGTGCLKVDAAASVCLCLCVLCLCLRVCACACVFADHVHLL